MPFPTWKRKQVNVAGATAASAKGSKNLQEQQLQQQQLQQYEHDIEMIQENQKQRIASTTTTTNNTTARLIERNLPFGQSRNKVQVCNTYGQMNYNNQKSIRTLLWSDWYHVLLRTKLFLSLSGLLIIWTSKILVFALLYYIVDRSNPNIQCGLGFNGNNISWRASFAFSLQTCTTVGYTLPSGSNSFFNNCPEIQTVIFMQMITSIIFNAFLFAFVYVRLSKCDSRAMQVLFSSTALISINNVNDPNQYESNQQQVRFQVRIFDLSSSQAPVAESHVRVYAVLKNNTNTTDSTTDSNNSTTGNQEQQLRLLRLIQPNDTMGGMLFLSIPSVIVHPIDIYSVLHPPIHSQYVQSNKWLSNLHYPIPVSSESSRHGSSTTSNTATATDSTDTITNNDYVHNNIDNNNIDTDIDGATSLQKQRNEIIQKIVSLPYPIHTTTQNGFGLRSADSRTGSREEILCPICGESYGTVERWIRHVRYNQLVEHHDYTSSTGKYNKNGNDNDDNDNNNDNDNDNDNTTSIYDNPSLHSFLTDDMIEQIEIATQPITDISILKEYFQQTISEIIVIVEAIEPTVSGSFCGLQSYTIDDIVFADTVSFLPCIVKQSTLNARKHGMTPSLLGNALKNDTHDTLKIDLDAFHGVHYTNTTIGNDTTTTQENNNNNIDKIITHKDIGDTSNNLYYDEVLNDHSTRSIISNNSRERNNSNKNLLSLLNNNTNSNNNSTSSITNNTTTNLKAVSTTAPISINSNNSHQQQQQQEEQQVTNDIRLRSSHSSTGGGYQSSHSSNDGISTEFHSNLLGNNDNTGTATDIYQSNQNNTNINTSSTDEDHIEQLVRDKEATTTTTTVTPRSSLNLRTSNRFRKSTKQQSIRFHDSFLDAMSNSNNNYNDKPTSPLPKMKE